MKDGLRRGVPKPAQAASLLRRVSMKSLDKTATIIGLVVIIGGWIYVYADDKRDMQNKIENNKTKTEEVKEDTEKIEYEVRDIKEYIHRLDGYNQGS